MRFWPILVLAVPCVLACERELEPEPVAERRAPPAATDGPGDRDGGAAQRQDDGDERAAQRQDDGDERTRVEGSPRTKTARARPGGDARREQPDGGEVVVHGSPRAPSTGLAGVPAPALASPPPSAVVPPMPSPGAAGGLLGPRPGNLLPSPALSLPSGATSPVLGGTATAPPFTMPFGGGSSLGAR